MQNGINIISMERSEQVIKHGFDQIHDITNYSDNEELEQVMLYILTGEEKYYPVEWNRTWKVKIDQKDKIGKMAVLGALAAAKIDVELFHKSENTISNR